MPDITQQQLPQASVAEFDSLADRTRRLLDKARYLNLATLSARGRPWVATLQYAWLDAPLRFLFGSATGSQHSRDIAASPWISGSLFATGGGNELDIAAVDGAQFTGRCSEIAATDLNRYHSVFYEYLFPDEQERARWTLPRSSLRPPGRHRLYLIEVERWWLIDTRSWEKDRIDRRLELPVKELGVGQGGA